MIECLKKLHPNTSLSKLDIEKYESVVIIKKKPVILVHSFESTTP